MRNINNLPNKFSSKYLVALIATLVLTAQASTVQAVENEPLLDRGKFSIGTGISTNSIDGPISDEIGFQFFGTYDLTMVNLMEGVNSSVDVGFMDYGFSNNSTGLWSTYVVSGKFAKQFGWLGRLGFDFGDDSGVMFGVGADYTINKKMDIRLEYVVRDEVDSLQFNFLYRL
ncbi:hypothetical protein MNBD_GAMMA08-1440 [hydrothermal vent metagenome]|uniref:Outer membrane protein beta-barrel domain-containing protein n=1 Tax=hydrothermal vent metagenome TaxID=652676 RepID=A0A3B0WZW9_9ZZZZ